MGEVINIFYWRMVLTEKSVMRVTNPHHEAYRVMSHSDPE